MEYLGSQRTVIHALANAGARGKASPSPCVIDSQSVKITRNDGPRGYAGGKKITCHIATDPLGLMIEAVLHTAAIQDGGRAVDVLKAARFHIFGLRHIFASGGYVDYKFKRALFENGNWTIEIIKRSYATQ